MHDSVITLGLAVLLILPINQNKDNINNSKHDKDNSFPSISVAASDFFKSEDSIGNIAICHAEGNCVNGQKTFRYYGHIDPGNGVFNTGYCSSQKQNKTIKDANQACLNRTNESLPRILDLMVKNSINPDKNQLLLVNIVDLHNQASDWVWQNAINFYAKNNYLSGDDLIIESRVYGFYRDGKFDASGLFNACRIKGDNQKENYACIKRDQSRRFKEIKGVLR